MPLILGANSASGGYTVKNSIRFNSASSDYLSRTPSTSGNRRTWTWSAWIKLSKLATNADRQYLFTATDNSTDTAGIYYGAYGDQTLTFENGGITLQLRASANLFRDVSAWYHIVAVLDTTQATSTDRAKLYVNNTLITSYTSSSNYPSQNADGIINSTGFLHTLSSYYGTSNFFNGYMAETYLIDGQALTPSSFGETDTDTGIWIPKSYSGSYGTNGFFLKFLNSASLGTDSSGNGNTFTVNNLTSVDQSTDTPTNNFCTMNPLNNGGLTISEGNTKATAVGSHHAITSTMAVDKGKWYWEVKNGTDAGGNAFGVMGTESKLSDQLNSTPSIWTRSSGNKFKDSVDGGAYMSFVNGDIIGVALDMDNGTIIFYKNGTSQGTAYSSINNGTVYSPAFKFVNSGDTASVNFGNPNYSANSYTDGAGYGNFSYAVPSGYYSLNTKNLAEFG